MAFPDPNNYGTWQEFARALVKVIQDTGIDTGDPLSNNLQAGTVTVPPATTPEGYVPVWLSQADAELFLGISDKSPPIPANLFEIDSTNIKNAAVNTQHVADAAIKTAQIGDAAIVSALIGDLQVITAKIALLAVNSAQIASLAVTTGKIANLAVGTAQIQDLAATNAKIGLLDAAKIITGILSSVSGNSYWDLDAGLIIQRSGIVRTVMGTAFGASFNLMRWFGLDSVPVGSEDISNCIWAEAIDGNIYYGGASLIPGTSPVALSYTNTITTNGETVGVWNTAASNTITTTAGGQFRITVDYYDVSNPGISTADADVEVIVDYGGTITVFSATNFNLPAGGGTTADLGSFLRDNPNSGSATVSLRFRRNAGGVGGSIDVSMMLLVEYLV